MSLAAMLFAVALPLVFETDAQGSATTWQKALTGWLFVISLQTPVWLALPLLPVAWIFILREWPRTALVLSALAFLAAAAFPATAELRYGWGDSIHTLRQTPGPGYYALLASSAATLASAFSLRWRVRVTLHALRTPALALAAVAVAIAAALVASDALSRIANRVEAFVYQVAPELAPAQRHKPYVDVHDGAFTLARREALQWNVIRLPADVSQALEHAPAGVAPAWLRVTHRPRQLLVESTHPAPISVEAWFTFESPAEVRLACRYELRKQMIDGRVLRLRPAESGVIQLTTEEKPFPGLCLSLDGKAPLELLVRLEDGRPIFASDTLLLPGPPANAERLRIAPF